MAMGQGATMALPIFAYYMQKVYKDKSLGYSEEELFDLPEDFDPCENLFDEEDKEEVASNDEEVIE